MKLESGFIVDEKIKESFLRVDRKRFAPGGEAANAYEDTPLKEGKLHMSYVDQN